MITNYQFTKVAAPAQLEEEIQASAIVTAIESIVLNGADDLNVSFKDALSNGDETILNGLITAHTPVAVADPFVQKVVTLMELDDKTLGLVSVVGDFVDNVCTLELLVPGTPGSVGRFVKEGYAFTDAYAWGLRIVSVALVDKDYAYAGIFYPAEPAPGVTWAQAMPNGVVLGDYADLAVAEINRGWRMWAEEGGQGGCDVDSLAGYGSMYAACYLRLVFQKPANSSPAHVAVDLQWGVPNA